MFDTPSNSLSGARSEKDKDGKREEFYLTSGKTLVAESRDPFGFWFFKWEKQGVVPERLSHAFTSKAEAVKALHAYLAMDTYDDKLSPVKVELPELKTKNDKKNA